MGSRADLPDAGGRPIDLLRGAEAAAVSASSARPRTEAGDRAGAPRELRRLRGREDVAAAGAGVSRGGPRPGGPPDGRTELVWCGSGQDPADNHLGPDRGQAGRPGRARLRGGGAKPALGGRLTYVATWPGTVYA